MNLKKTFWKTAVICGLAVMAEGVLPAPMCPNCRTPGQFSTYMQNVQSQPGILTQLWNLLTSRFS